jgi:hypothetical protein
MPQVAPPDFQAKPQTETERNPSTGGRDTHISVPGGVFHNPASAYAREMAKFEMDWGPFGPPGRPRHAHGHPTVPCQMYLVERAETGGGVVVKHSVRAEDEHEMRNWQSRGYYSGLAEAAEALTKSEQEKAELAANRAFQERRMSDAAREEAARIDASTAEHVPVIPETPIVRRQAKS